MKVAVYSTHQFETEYLIHANNGKHELHFINSTLNQETVLVAAGCKAISIFVTDKITADIAQKLHTLGVRYIVLRSAGYNHVDVIALQDLGIKAARVPAYSPYAVAEHAMALILAMDRKLIKAHTRIIDLNFSLDGLVGFDLHGKTAGVIGTGKIGSVMAKILHGFGCRLLAYDQYHNKELSQQLGIEYADCETLCRQSDIITLHIPLLAETHHIINRDCIGYMKPGVMLINTSRGELIDTVAVIEGLKSGKIGYFGMDVYEEEEQLFFEDHSDDILQDEIIARLMTFGNVLITGHQAFLTREALQNIALTTIANLDSFETGQPSENELLNEHSPSTQSK